MQYDAILLVSFGGPEKPEDVMPFLENVLRGKNVPRERMMVVADHYATFGGKSPINDQNRELIAELRAELNEYGPKLPVYWGNRNWHPLLPHTLRQMKADGVKRVLAFATSAFSSYSGCRQYRENIASARAAVGDGAPVIDKLRVFFNHPGFIEAQVERVQEAISALSAARLARAAMVFTAHSIPTSMADGCGYFEQLQEASRLVAERFGRADHRLVFQSRSGPPTQPWLEPDILEYLREVKAAGEIQDVIVIPIGFVSDHLEVIYDLDTAARAVCDDLGLNLIRVGTVGTHPRFVRMIRELIVERMEESPVRAAVGILPARPDVCPDDCCPAPQGPAGRRTA